MVWFGDQGEAESQLGFEHRVACGGPGGSPHATGRCPRAVVGPETRAVRAGIRQLWPLPRYHRFEAGPGPMPRGVRSRRRVDGTTRVC